MKKYLMIYLLCLSLTTFAKSNVVNVYNWSGYISPQVLTLFEKETGIQVNYSTFDENETLYTKLKADPYSNYDVVVPSCDTVDRMRKEGMLHQLDKSQLPNIKNINPALLNRPFDPHNQYSIPYLWGTTGILINTKYYSPKSIHYWSDLWNPRFKNQVSMMNDPRDVFAVAFIVLGYSINEENPEHIKAAYLKLRALLPNIQSFTGDGSQQMFINEDSHIGMMESGDANEVMRENQNFHYIYPKDGVIIWMDNMAIPAHAPHLENAYRFMNFILRPEIAKMISLSVGFSTPNLKAIASMDKNDRNNRVINPEPEDLKKGQIELDITKAAEKAYYKYWELLKLG
ncbi:MAG: spermidine/putrescine ABC transporter substrate-binding protein [Gammaproteobacteria bacterium]|nr:spermidine/putrescine ABC transporter substrate-binding protein [Gammaproteobacteria bacterium]